MKRFYITGAILILTILGFSDLTFATENGRIVSGSVSDMNGDPVVGATVVAETGSQPLQGKATDTDGRFTIRINDTTNSATTLYISAVGFRSREIPIKGSASSRVIDVKLEQVSIDMGSFEVIARPEDNVGSDDHHISHEQVDRRGKASLVSNNPISAIREPQLANRGSAHSSRIRVGGSNPDYYLNNVRIGHDPDHYGMFSIIPGSVVGKIDFYSHGTPAEFQLPVAINLETPNRYEHSLKGEFDLSMVQTTGTLSYGNRWLSTMVSLRKSVLDKLVHEFEISTDRRTIPPTNFQDIFATTAIKLSANSELALDQIYTGDHLDYTAGSATGVSSDTRVYQRTTDRILNTRFRTVLGQALLTASAGRKASSELYLATPTVTSPLTLSVDLEENLVEYNFKSMVRWFNGPYEITVGGSALKVAFRETSVHQTNWNFLPPDANSDTPYPYQTELNQSYGDYLGHSEQTTVAGHGSLARVTGPLRFEAGLRYQDIGGLVNGRSVLARCQVSVHPTATSSLSLQAGTYAENPVNRVLESYQVLTRANLEYLSPIKTDMLGTAAVYGPVELGLFAKRISNLPTPVPDFASLSADGVAGERFISMRSEGSLRIHGGNLMVDLSNLWNSRLTLYAAYGLSKAVRISNGIAIPYELNATHRFTIESSLRVSRVLTVGAEFDGRSGYPHTPSDLITYDNSGNRYAPDYFWNLSRQENSASFPMSASINLYCGFDFGKSELYASISNVTDRSNAMISTHSGYVYDAGILPAVGLRVRF